MKCPHCGLFNPPEALRCDCGHDFKAGVVLESFLRDRSGDTRPSGPLDGRLREVSAGVGLITGVFSFLAVGAPGYGALFPLLLLAGGAVVLVVAGLGLLFSKNNRALALLLLSAGGGVYAGLVLGFF